MLLSLLIIENVAVCCSVGLDAMHGAQPPPTELPDGSRLLRAHSDEQPRAPPSMSNPSYLLGVPIETEDDVLHVEDLPDFDGRVQQRDAELLMSYLTVPYLRIPMILGFFCRQECLSALANADLQAVIDACLFEPGLWEPPSGKEMPEYVPARTRGHLATPLGLLFNELLASPRNILQASAS